jgi:protein O-mannosyl-transferase
MFLLLAVAMVFGQTLGHEFLNNDDEEYVYWNNEVKNGLTLHGVQWAFTANHSANWHPLTWLSHMLDCQLFGPHADLNANGSPPTLPCGRYSPYAWGHHLTNVLLHAAATVLLFLVLWRMTGSLWPSAFVAAVFAIHPLRVESVAWVAERKDVLSGLFFMLTLAAYVHYSRRPFSIARYLAVFASFALGLMAKPMLVTLPFVLLLLDYWPLGRMSLFGDSSRSPETTVPSSPWHLFAEKLPLLALSAASCAATLWAQGKAIALNEHIVFPSRLANAVVAAVDYIVQLFCPMNLAPMYPHPLDSLPVWRIVAASATLAAISAAAWIARRRYPYIIVGWLWYLGMLLPVIGLVQVGLQARADRYTYLPQIGLVVALAWSAAAIVARWPRCLRLCQVGGVAVVLILMACAWQQTTYWHDSKTLWTHTLACTSNNALAHQGFGITLAEAGQRDDAVAEFETALTIQPNLTAARLNLAKCLEHQGKVDRTITEYRRVVQELPDLPSVRNSLATLLARRGETIEAVSQWREVVRLQPNNLRVLNELAWALATSSDASLRNGLDAVAFAKRAAQIAGGRNASVLATLAAAYAENQQFREAIEVTQQGIAIANQAGNTAMADALRARLKLYQSGIPYRELR